VSELGLRIHQAFSVPTNTKDWVLGRVSQTVASQVALAAAADPEKKSFFVAIQSDGKTACHEIASQFGISPRSEHSRRFIVE
jgi:phage terminase small subunit